MAPILSGEKLSGVVTTESRAALSAFSACGADTVFWILCDMGTLSFCHCWNGIQLRQCTALAALSVSCELSGASTDLCGTTGMSTTLSMKRRSKNDSTVYVALCNQRLRYHVMIARR